MKLNRKELKKLGRREIKEEKLRGQESFLGLAPPEDMTYHTKVKIGAVAIE